MGPQGHGRRRGRALLFAQRRRHHRHRPRGVRPALRPLRGRIHHHPAARAQHHPVRGAVRPDHRAQGPRGLHRHGDGEDLLQGRDLDDVPQLHLLRPRRLRHPGRLQDLPLEKRQRAHARRGGPAHRPAQLAVLLRPHRQPRRGPRAPQQGPRQHAAPGHHHAGRARRRARRAARPQRHRDLRLRHHRVLPALLRGLRQGALAGGVLNRRPVQRRPHRQDHARPRSPAGGRVGGSRQHQQVPAGGT